MDKVAVVTGAARGIGLAIARRFLAGHWRVAMLDIDAVTLAAAVWFLCSDEASYVNCQMLAVDGGFDAAGIGLRALRDEGGEA